MQLAVRRLTPPPHFLLQLLQSLNCHRTSLLHVSFESHTLGNKPLLTTSASELVEVTAAGCSS